jgi:hypothetical protein
MRQTRGSLYLITGLLLGIALGLAFAWLIKPVDLQDALPNSLQAQYKDQYRELAALAFISNGDLVRAKARLALLGDENPQRSVQEQLARLAVQGETSEVTALRLLLAALEQN